MGLVAALAGCADDLDTGNSDEAVRVAVRPVALPPTVVSAIRETYRAGDLSSRLATPISRSPDGTFACGPLASNNGVTEARDANGVRTYRLRCGRLAGRTQYVDQLVISVDERHASEAEIAEGRACATRFARFGADADQAYFTAALGYGSIACAVGATPNPTALASHIASGGLGYPAPGLPHASVPPGVLPEAPVQLRPWTDQQAEVPPWAVSPNTPVVWLTSDLSTIRFDVTSVADPRDLTTWDPTSVHPEIGSYTWQIATEPTGATSCDDWQNAPGVLFTSNDPFEDTIVMQDATDDGKPSYRHRVDLALAGHAWGPWTDNAALTHVLWVRVVPRAKLLGGEAGDPPLPSIPGVDPSPCVVAPSNWVPIGVIDDLTYADALLSTMQAALDAYFAKLPLAPQDLYDIRFEAYTPPRLFDQMPLKFPTAFGSLDGYIHSYPLIAQTDHLDHGVSRGVAFDSLRLNAHLHQGSSGLGKVLSDGLGLVVGTLGKASELYEDLKSEVASTIAGLGCAAVPVNGCTDFVAAAAKGAIEYGLASMGIPPRIPNAKELMDNGVDYLATMAADEAAAQLPGGDALAEAARAEARDAAHQAVGDAIHGALDAVPMCPARNDDGSCDYDDAQSATWGLPDPFYRAHPATIALVIEPKDPAAYAELLATQPERLPDLGNVILRDHFCVFAPHAMRLPRVIPVGGVRLRLPLQASFEAGAPGTSPWGATCEIPTPAAWEHDFGDNDLTGEATYGIRYPSSTNDFFFQLMTYDWHAQATTLWDAQIGNAGLPTFFGQQHLTESLDLPAPFIGPY